MNVNTTESDQSNSLASKECPDCEKCLQVLHMVIDGECSSEEKAFVEAHISSCTHCSDCYEVDKTIKESIHSKITKMNVPHDLVNFIKSKIGEATI
ncbi:MAG: zf-HC2 domain-containing protein [Microscillaceae bacterium]|nr:zf-HC2 domain-containing protein [Microscillaceae bacterium]